MSGIPSWARVEAKVVYIGGEGRGFGADWAPELATGEVYTIERVEVVTYRGEQFAAISVVESPIFDAYGIEYGRDIALFRPLHTLESDLEAHFSALLTVSTPQPEEVQ